MSIGLGHHYLVQVIKHFYGQLDECIQFMEDNKFMTKDNDYWFELRPIPVIKGGSPIKTYEYSCDLVKDGKLK